MTLSEWLKAKAKTTEDFRTGTLFDEDVNINHLDPLSQQYFLLALASLEAAHRYFEIASIQREKQEL